MKRKNPKSYAFFIAGCWSIGMLEIIRAKYVASADLSVIINLFRDANLLFLGHSLNAFNSSQS